MSQERYLSAKELAEAFRVRGIRPCSYDAMLILIRRCDGRVGMTVRLSEAMAVGRDFRPFSKKPGNFPPSSESVGLTTL